ncbi:ExbD/TolR family protein [Neptunomonas antarctica]|uniref:Biopolymer transport protein ExbD n=1 Tax=Neptunomonas antarctica TaxID=619304 RepID=A0A1N7LQL7_9GAMM|nr:biopolymer transporter ExbD [Neptunomonas antarctica]SIS76145.1 biopolymer transport protein ExbD [Neptunomonas antarctica]
MKFQRQSREEVSVNLTPLIDVVFLLLIFFMISTTFTKDSRLEIDLPQASDAPSSQSPGKIIEIVIDAEGQYSVDGKPLVNTQAKTLRLAIRKLMIDDEKLPLVITADAKTPHQSVVTAMDISGKLGFEKLSITTMQTTE